MTDRPKRSGNDRRRFPNRRKGVDRRVVQEHVTEDKPELRSGKDRRDKRDRRSWVERRNREPS